MTDVAEESPHQSAVPWVTPGQLSALNDLVLVYDRHFERVQAERRALARQVPELAALVEQSDPERFTAWERRKKELLRSPTPEQWALYRAHLLQESTWYAASGIALRVALENGRTLMTALSPLLLEAYGSEPARLAGAFQALIELGNQIALARAEAYLARTEANLRAREEDLATTLDSIGDAVIVTDVEGRVTRMNPVAERLTGYTLVDCRGQPLDQIFKIENEDTHEPVESPVARVLREGTVVGLANHTELIARDGSRCPIADSGAPIKRGASGDVRGVVLVFRDVSEERRAEEALRHWQRIFQHATWGVATANVKDILFQAVNPAYAAMHGYTVDELLGQPVSLLWAPETEQDMQRHADETHHHGRLRVETTHLRKDGTRMPVEIVATTIKNARGELEWFVANVQDISERKEFQLARIRAIELEAENRRIQEANRLKGEFLANMSHELRTPLNSIIGFAQLLHDEQVGRVEPQQKEFLGDILSGGLHLLRLINDVLDLAKVEAGKMDFRPEPVELATLVNAVVQGLRSAAANRRIQVVVELDPALREIELDPARFKQLLYNYLSNALKFSPEGGRVTIRALPEDEHEFKIEVEDAGPGIATGDMRQLFTPFQQLDSGSARRHGGTGLGLALTKRLAEAQGGRVGMRAAEPQGSIFYAVLPRRPGPPAASSERRSDGAQALHGAFDQANALALGEPVVVVDDDAASLRLMEATLAKLGYQSLCFTNAKEALAAIIHVRPLAVVLDLLMPTMDGFTFLEGLRASPATERTPVMIWTVKDLSREDLARLERVADTVQQKGAGEQYPLSRALSEFLPPRSGTKGAAR